MARGNARGSSGRLDVLKLPELSDIEKMVLSNERMYAVVQKVAAESNERKEDWQRMRLKGHSLGFVHSGPEAFAQKVTTSIEERKEEVLSKVRCTPRGCWDNYTWPL